MPNPQSPLSASAASGAGTDAQSTPVGETAPLFEIMATLRAMRRLKPDPVPPEMLERLVQAATWGPSGSNLQGYEFVVVTDRAVMQRLAELWGRSVDAYLNSIGRVTPGGQDAGIRRAVLFQRDHFNETPALIVACYRSSRLGSPNGESSPDQPAAAGGDSPDATSVANQSARRGRVSLPRGAEHPPRCQGTGASGGDHELPSLPRAQMEERTRDTEARQHLPRHSHRVAPRAVRSRNTPTSHRGNPSRPLVATPPPQSRPRGSHE